MKILANRIRELRLSHGLTQKELGMQCNVSKASISYYESGNRLPDIETLTNLARTLGVSISYLVGQEQVVFAEEDPHYKIHLSQRDLRILSEIRKYPKLYNYLIENTENTVELLNKKLI